MEVFPPTYIASLSTTNNLEKTEMSRGIKPSLLCVGAWPTQLRSAFILHKCGTISSGVSQSYKSPSFKVRIIRLSMCVVGPFSLSTFVQRELRRVNSCCSYLQSSCWSQSLGLTWLARPCEQSSQSPALTGLPPDLGCPPLFPGILHLDAFPLHDPSHTAV